ncbi:hypothetical protein BJ878DRAFT_259213 [Calycina marina]|uniref:Uncharacterized protein n=1 Tax=Calycina marina TaxID=1763456 RepID=A0A9P8CD52_9HELO|nr:hypothetical protein BJ878DRAFT_259213 [Calycina marina]
MMAARRSVNVQPDFGYSAPPNGAPSSSRSFAYNEATRAAFDNMYYATTSAPYSPVAHVYNGSTTIPSSSAGFLRSDPVYSSGYNVGISSAVYGTAGPGIPSQSTSWDQSPGRASPEAHLEDYYVEDPQSLSSGKSSKSTGKSQSQQRRPSNRDEFDGPHQFLQKPSPEYIAKQESDLPHLPTSLVVHEQDSVLTQVNDRLSQCAFDFVAKYQFPIPIDQATRPVARPQDREWTEWVYLLKRLATKRRIPARVLYNGQIKQFVAILENSLDMRHDAKHQSRPLKDDRNLLQLISAGIQVAKILKDSLAMCFLDQLYVTTERRIQERSLNRAHR